MKRMTVKIVLKSIEILLRALSICRSGVNRDKTRTLLEFFPTANNPCPPDSESPRNRLEILVVIPFRDRWDLTSKCCHSLIRDLSASPVNTSLPEVRVTVALVDNGSKEPATAEGIRSLLSKDHGSDIVFKSLRDDSPFNFSRLNNVAVRQLSDESTDFVLFLNNDMELKTPDTLRTCAQFLSTHTNAGGVGCTLLYPDQTIQHLFLCPGIKIVAAHPGKGWPFNPRDSWFQQPRRVPALTGAFLMVRRQDFLKLNGFEESLAQVGQDLDLCLRLEELGREFFHLSELVAIHYETATPGRRIARHEVEWIYARWGKKLTQHPLVPRALSRWSETPTRTMGEGDYPWKWVI